MRFSFRIALRYLFSKSSQTVVNRINLFAVIVLTVSSASLLIVLSGFEGLKDFGMDFYKKFEPDYKVLPKNGKTLVLDKIEWNNLKNSKEILSASRVIEEKVFLSFEGRNQAAYIRGVSSSYTKINPIDSLIVVGEWIDFELNSVVLGYELSSSLGVGIYDYSSFLELSVPKKGKLRLGENPFKTIPGFVNGLFQVSEDIDKKYAFCSIDFARELLNYRSDEFSYVSIKGNPNYSQNEIFLSLKRSIKSDFFLQSRIEQNPALFKMMNTENLAVYLIFTLVIIIALFNLVGSLIMMSVDKSSQLNLLYALGESPKNIQNIFLILGLLVSFIGSFGGVLIGSLILFIQDLFPFVFVPGTSLAYPVSLISKNIFIVLLTVLFLGGCTSVWATRNIQNSLD